MPPRRTPADYRALAEARGLRWLGPEVAGTRAKTTWTCPQGHEWRTTYASVRAGSGCPICAGNAPKTPEDYVALAERRGFRWLGPVVPNNCTPTGWQCPRGHQWQTPYASVRSGTNCPICVGNRRKTPDDYRALAESRGLRWIGPEVGDVFTPTGWECRQGHRWQTAYQNIRRAGSCPACHPEAGGRGRRRKKD